jgi:uncharacterized protein (TIGR00290 family)
MKPKALFNWSGGKDSALCLYKLMQSGEYDIKYLLTTVSKAYNRISQHGVRAELLEQQTSSIGIPLYKLILPEFPTMETYNTLMKETLNQFKNEGISISVFGDIFLEDLRKYREEKLAEAGFTGLFPIWKTGTEKLIREFIDLGFKAVIVCVDEKKLDKSFAGREIDDSFLNNLPKDVDPCGENGEYHSFVYAGPVFKKPVAFTKGEIVYRQYNPPPKENNNTDYTCGYDTKMPVTGFWYCDLVPHPLPLK